jgi:hypothetical protein
MKGFDMQRTLSDGRSDPAYGPKRRTTAELQGEIVLWSNRLPVGSEWKHWSGKVFEIVGHGIDKETGTVEVQYREASLGERPHPLYAVGSIAPINPEVVMHRDAEDWEERVTVHKGQMLPAAVVQAMSAGQKLTVANERSILPRHRRVHRIEQFVEIERV